ncbi:hypothetical protein [Sphingomonas pituitosa]|uniref:hypothetical protein n=1 Tax=Sphingomonas pituitosa TaxID=99597 RepID=UPI00083136D5|nr:hypothetical protein [Sphingomonas pituitosa]
MMIGLDLLLILLGLCVAGVGFARAMIASLFAVSASAYWKGISMAVANLLGFVLWCAVFGRVALA